jgi:hypothetical protein
MGGVRFSASDYTDYTTKTKGMGVDDRFKAKTVHEDLNPLKIEFRESCDSDANPQSTPLMVFVDETGSMGQLANIIIGSGLGIIMNEIYDRKPITDPHILVGGVGDSYFDRYPLQPSQFEAGAAPLIDQITKIVIEKGGGNNHGESYMLPWYFAAFKTKTDSMLKRGKKGYLFTIGDEPLLPNLPAEHIKRIFGDDVQAGFTSKELYEKASESWEIFHLVVGRRGDQFDGWRELLEQRVIKVDDHEKLAEVIVSVLQVAEGHDKDKVMASWSGDTSLVVANAVKDMVASKSGATDVVTL